MNLQPIHPNFVCQVWPAVKGMLADALEFAGGEYTVEQLQCLLVRGEQHLLVLEAEDGIAGAGVVAFQNYPSSRVAFITALGGECVVTPDWYELLAEWCRGNGCTHIQAAARESAARLFKRVGFDPRYIIVEQKL